MSLQLNNYNNLKLDHTNHPLGSFYQDKARLMAFLAAESIQLNHFLSADVASFYSFQCMPSISAMK